MGLKDMVPSRAISRSTSSTTSAETDYSVSETPEPANPDADGVSISPHEKEVIVGNLLGTAEIVERGDDTAYYTQEDENREYLEHLKEEVPSIFSTSPISQASIADRYVINSENCQRLMNAKDRFYNYGEKIFPKWLWFTPTILKYWYISDGRVSSDYNPELNCGWLDEVNTHRVKWLLQSTLDEGSDITILKSGEEDVFGNQKLRIAFTGEAGDKFYNYIGDCPVECYENKWSRFPSDW